MRIQRLVRAIVTSATTLATLLMLQAASAIGQGLARDLPPRPLAEALEIFAEQTGLQLVYRTELASGLQSKGARAGLSAEETLRELLRETGLTFEFVNDRTVAIRVTQLDGRRGDLRVLPRDVGVTSTSRTRYRIAQAPQGTDASSTNGDQDAGRPRVNGADERVDLGEVVVTGTRVKGVNDAFSPVTTVTRDQMDLAGHVTVSDVLNSLPQNFGGGVTPDTTSANSAEGAGSSSVNLRGLGNEATLILLNGRRLAPTGVTGNFVDVSAIPTSVIDRIEVLTDGASAIYGSDAIGGVVNIILRDDFDGAETRLNLSTLADGASDTINAGQTFGWRGERGHGLVTYDYTSQEELDSSDREFLASRADPTYILPSVETHNAFASGGLDFSGASVTADAYYSERATESFNSFSGNQDFQRLDVEQFGAAAGVKVPLFADWESDLSASYSRNSFLSNYTRIIPANGGTVDTDSQTEISSIDASMGGSLFRISTEAVRGVFGIHFRSENADLLSTGNPGAIVRVDTEQSRDVFAAFGELYAPLVSAADAIPGARGLAVTLAARYDDYSDVGSSFDPKIGGVWSPVAGLNIRGTYGTSFRAARLEQLRDSIPVARLGIFVDPESPTGESVALLVLGTSSDVDPEEAESWTAGFDLLPELLEGFRLRATYFSVEYDGRLGAPSARFDSLGRWSVFTGNPTRGISQPEVQGLLDSADFIQDLSVFFPYLSGLTPEDVTVLLDSRQQNLSASNVEGIDVEIVYDAPSDFGDWTFSLTSTILTSVTQRVTPTTPVLDLLDTFANPIDLRVRGNVTWQTTPVTAALYVNYIDDYTDDEVPSGFVPVDSWTTIDASLRLELGEVFEGGFAEDALLTLNVTNLFGEDPPAIVSTTARNALGVVYDAPNADPTGRRFGVSLMKRW